MTGWLAGQPYLAANLLGLAATLAAMLWARGERARTLLAGALALIAVPAGTLFDGSYWTPRRGGFLLPVEDALYLFELGARGWLCALPAARFLPAERPSPRRALGRGAAATVTGSAVLAGGILTGLAAGDALMVVVALVIALLLWREPGHWRAAACSALLCGLWFSAELRLWFALWPEMAPWWTPQAWTTRPLLGVPVGDVVTAALVGPAHALTLAWMLGGRFAPRHGA